MHNFYFLILLIIITLSYDKFYSRQPIVFREFVNQRQFGAFLLGLFHDKATLI